MRIQDLFGRFPESISCESENIETQPKAEINTNQTNTEPVSKIGILATSDQFETIKPNLLDRMIPGISQTPSASEEIPNTYSSTTGVRGEIWRTNLKDNDLLPAPSPTENFRYNMEYHLTRLAKDPGRFETELTKMYGDNYDAGKAENLRQRVLAGDFSWLPKIESKPGSELDRKFAAYDPSTNVIYVNESKRQPILGFSTFNPLQEIMYTKAYSTAIWTAMRRELDPVDADKTGDRYLGTINVDGQSRNIEWITLEDPFGGLGNKLGYADPEDSIPSIAAIQKRWR